MNLNKFFAGWFILVRNAVKAGRKGRFVHTVPAEYPYKYGQSLGIEKLIELMDVIKIRPFLLVAKDEGTLVEKKPLRDQLFKKRRRSRDQAGYTAEFLKLGTLERLGFAGFEPVTLPDREFYIACLERYEMQAKLYGRQACGCLRQSATDAEGRAKFLTCSRRAFPKILTGSFVYLPILKTPPEYGLLDRISA